jgi:hypothetical protein
MLECWHKGGSQWEDADHKVRLLVDTDNSRPRVIGVSGVPNSNATEWSMMLFGSSTTALFRTDTKSITGTKTSSTIKSKTLNWLARSLTSECTADANGAAMNGGSHAETAEPSTLFLNTTSARLASLLGAGNAALPMRLRISASAARSEHPTVKPTTLMRYLCRLITPPGGTVLDPFMGSGSTGKAARLEGFSFIGIEKEAEYMKIARKRIAAARSNNGHSNGQTPKKNPRCSHATNH